MKLIKNPHIVFYLCGMAFLIHFTMILLHNTPEKYLTPRMESYSHLYSYPMFHQGWALFAPEPQKKHKRMEMRYASDGAWGEWYRADRICIEEHRRYRVTHFSKLCHVTQNTTYHLWMDVDLFNQQKKNAVEYYGNSMGYGIACEFAANHAYHFLDRSEFDSLQIKLVLEDPFEVLSPEVLLFPTHVSE